MKKVTISTALLIAITSMAFIRVQNEKKSNLNHSITVNQLNTNQMETQAKQVVQEFLTAAQQGNHEKVNALLHPDVQWHQPGNHKFAGLKKSSAEVFQMLGSIHAYTVGTYALEEIKWISANGDTVACLLHFKGATPVANLNIDNIDIYTVRDGKITEVVIYSQDLEKENMFFGN